MKNLTHPIIAILFSALLLTSCSGNDGGGGTPTTTPTLAPDSNTGDTGGTDDTGSTGGTDGTGGTDETTIIPIYTGPAMQFASTSTDIDAAFLTAYTNVIKIAFDIDNGLCGVAGTGTGADPDVASFDKAKDYLPITAQYRVGASGSFVTATDQPKISGLYPPGATVPSDDWNVKRATDANEYHGDDVFYLTYTVPSQIRTTTGSVLKFTLGDPVASAKCKVIGNKTHEVNIKPTIARLQFTEPYATAFAFSDYTSQSLWPVLRATGGTCGVPGYRKDSDKPNAYTVANGSTQLADNQYIKLKIEYKNPGETAYTTVTNPGDRVSRLSAVSVGNPPTGDWSANANDPRHISILFGDAGYFFRYTMPPELDDASEQKSGSTLLRFTIEGNSITHGSTTCYFGPNKSTVYTMTKP